MTAEGLARRIRRDAGQTFSAERIEASLTAHASRHDRVVRYSWYPSAESLGILWGAISAVEEVKSLPKLTRDDDPEPFELTLPDVADARGHVFISHNYRDLDQVLVLCRALNRAGWRPWIFQSQIGRDGLIISSVRDALSSAARVLVYVSARSVGSLWVQKELRVADDDIVRLVFDGNDNTLMGLTGNETGAQINDLVDNWTFEEVRPEDQGSGDPPRRKDRASDFLRIMCEYMRGTQPLFAIPSPKHTYPEHAVGRRAAGLDALIEDLGKLSS